MVEKLNEFMATRRINRKKLAELLNVPYVTLNLWLNGKQTPRAENEQYVLLMLEKLNKEIPSKV